MIRRMVKAEFRRRLRFESLEARIVFNADMLEMTRSLVALQSDSYHDDGTLRVDQRGLAYYFDEGGEALPGSQIDPSSAPPSLLDSSPTSSPLPGGDVPSYHSNASYAKKIFLDFDGQLVTGTPWNFNNYGLSSTGATIHAPPFSTDSDLANFSSSELATIQDVWARVAEDYAPFQVDVTTEDPGDLAFSAGGQAIRVLVSTNVDATTGQQWFPAAGGVAYLDSWYFESDTPVWVFTNHLGNGVPKYVAEAASHEVGHSFGLGHDGRISPAEDYYAGHGSGQTGWAPIMGVGYNRSLTQWSQGEYASASNTEDDLQIINTALAYAVDDHGNTALTATQLAVGSAGAVASSGLIATRSDKDAFRFATQAGAVTINVDPFELASGKGNLDVALTLVNAAGATVATVNSVSIVGASLTATVPKGYYTLLVDGIGKAAVTGDSGYSDYASLGKYSLSGSSIPNQAPIAVSDAASVQAGSSVLIDVLANDTDADLDTLSLQSVAPPTVGTTVIESGKVRFTPPAGFAGQASFSYVVADALGATAIGLVTINAGSVIVSRNVFYNGAEGTDAKNSLATDKFPLLPGKSSTFSNYTNYFRGLNGIVVDLAGLPAATTSDQILSSLEFAQWNGISVGGFTALPLAAVPTATILAGSGVSGSSRVRITFPDNTLQNTWLRVSVLANAFTGLAASDVFYFGNVIGEVNVDNTATRLRVNATDTVAVRSNQSTSADSASVTNIYDMNRDGRVNATDTVIVRSNQQTAGIVAPITAPTGSASSLAFSEGAAAPISPAPPENSADLPVDGNDDASLSVMQLPLNGIPATRTLAGTSLHGSGQQVAAAFAAGKAVDEPSDAKHHLLESLDEYFASLWNIL